jgi:hypothetical protein
MSSSEQVQPLLEALKAVAAALKADGVPFALAGGLAVYARGGKDSRHDVDFVVPGTDIAAAKDSLERRGMHVFQPPEDWLFKVEYDGQPVDIIHRLPGGPVDDELLHRAQDLSVESVRMPVLSATDLLIAKLLSLSEHACDLEPVLSVMRSVREQLDLDQVVEATRDHDFAEAALYLARRLEILPGAADKETGELKEAKEIA